jgi:hypothetical protein
MSSLLRLSQVKRNATSGAGPSRRKLNEERCSLTGIESASTEPESKMAGQSQDNARDLADEPNTKQTDKPWNGVPEKEQAPGTAKPDLEKWGETDTH